MFTLLLAAQLTAVAGTGAGRRKTMEFNWWERRFTARQGDDFFVKFFDRVGWTVVENAPYKDKTWDYLFRYVDTMNDHRHIHTHDKDHFCNGGKFMCSICSYLVSYHGPPGRRPYNIHVTGDTDYNYKCWVSSTLIPKEKYVYTMNVPRRPMTTKATTAATTTTATTSIVTATPACGLETATARCTCAAESASIFCNVGETCKAGQCIHPDCTIPKDITTLIPHAANSTCGHALPRNASCKVACKTGYTALGSGVLECGASMGRLSTIPACVAEGVESEAAVYVQSTMSLEIYIPDSNMLMQDTFKKVIMSSVVAVLGVMTTNVEITKVSLIDVGRRARVDVEFRVKASDAAAQAALATTINPGNATFTSEIKTQIGIKCVEASMSLVVLSFNVQPATTVTVYKPVDPSPNSTHVSSDSAPATTALATTAHSRTTMMITVLGCGLVLLAGSIALWKIF